MRKLLLATVALLGAATTAQASIIPMLASITPEGDLFRYSYTGTLASNAGVVDGSKLVIFDFAGFSGGFTVPNPNIVASSENVTPGTFSLDYTDDPTIANLVFTWVGAPFHVSGGPYPEVVFSGFSALSTYATSALDGFNAFTIKNTAPEGGSLFNEGGVGVPIATIPEPAVWGMMILGFAGMGQALRRSRRARMIGAA